MIRAFVLVVLAVLASIAPANAAQELSGMTVVIDPGHGGKDPGASGFFPMNGKKARITEDAYCYDVAVRLARIVRQKGGKAVLTIQDRSHQKPVANDPRSILEPKRKAVFHDGTIVRAGASGLRRRLEVAKKETWRSQHRKVFISIHFDALGNKDIVGVHMIAPKGRIPNVCKLLIEEFRYERRLCQLGGQEYYPLRHSGDRAHGMRNIFVLNQSPIDESVMVELGNFTNSGDVWRLRDYRVREHYAQIITRALKRLW